MHHLVKMYMFTSQEGPINPLGLFEKPSILVVLIDLLPLQNKLQPNQHIDDGIYTINKKLTCTISPHFVGLFQQTIT
jgi:hypothetical protein